MFLTCSDIEFLIIYLVLFSLFVSGLRKKHQYSGAAPLFVMDLPMSQAMKGIACVMILTSHWGLKRFGGVTDLGYISKVVWSMSAQIALVWFMFFSGYGMSLKQMEKKDIFNKWKKSCLKVYVPCLFICIVTFILFAFLPDNLSESTRNALGVDEDIHILHNLTWNGVGQILPNLFGHEFWYVECILIFYSMFYLSYWLSLKYRVDITWLLALFFVGYFFFARCFYGVQNAHFYRFCWTFMFGHAVAKRTKLSWAVFVFFLLTTLVEKELMNVYLWAMVSLLIVSLINNKFEMKGRGILYLGSISYIFYLSHIRIGYHILTYLHIDSIIVWTIIATISSAILYEINKRLIKRIVK